MSEKKEYIEREAAIQLIRECTRMQGKEIEKECDTPILRNVLNVYYLAREGATTLLEDIPAADVAPVVHGEWLLKHKGYGHYWLCSVCNTNPCIYVTENTKFCPNCGAKMDGGKHETD